MKLSSCPHKAYHLVVETENSQVNIQSDIYKMWRALKKTNWARQEVGEVNEVFSKEVAMSWVMNGRKERATGRGEMILAEETACAKVLWWERSLMNWEEAGEDTVDEGSMVGSQLEKGWVSDEQGEPCWVFSRGDTTLFDEEALAAVTVGWGG